MAMTESNVGLSNAANRDWLAEILLLGREVMEHGFRDCVHTHLWLSVMIVLMAIL